MSSNDSFNIFKECKNQFGLNMNTYRQKNINGYDCCFKPNVITFEKVNKYNEVNSLEPIKLNTYVTNVTQYLFYYQLLNMEGFPKYSTATKYVSGTAINSNSVGCKFFANNSSDTYYLFKDIIPASEFNMYTGTSTTLNSNATYENKIQQSFDFLFNYVKDSQLPILKQIQFTGNGEGVSLPNFDSNKITCNDVNDTVKYIKYQESNEHNYFEFFTICLPKNQNSIDLKNTNIYYQLFNYMNDDGSICTTNTCKSIEYPSVSGSYIGKPLAEQNNQPYNAVTITLIIFGSLAGLIILGFILYKILNSEDEDLEDVSDTVKKSL